MLYMTNRVYDENEKPEIQRVLKKIMACLNGENTVIVDYALYEAKEMLNHYSAVTFKENPAE